MTPMAGGMHANPVHVPKTTPLGGSVYIEARARELLTLTAARRHQWSMSPILKRQPPPSLNAGMSPLLARRFGRWVTVQIPGQALYRHDLLCHFTVQHDLTSCKIHSPARFNGLTFTVQGY